MLSYMSYDSDMAAIGRIGALRVARGAGAQSGHPRPVTLACEG